MPPSLPPDEKLDGVSKLGSNMYFYTGPGAASNESPINSDDEEDSKVGH